MNKQEKCTKCNELTEVVYFDEQGNAYCEDCWIEHEAELKGLR